MQIKKIFTKRLAYQLIAKGYNLVGMQKNYKKPWLDVFLFEKTDELLKELDAISKK